MTPKLSVLLPCWNAENFLQESLDSLFSQSFSDFEIIAIEDHSADGTLQILETAAAQDSRLRIMRNPGKGLASALNYGLQQSRGKYIARMDSDDICRENRFKEQIKFLDQNSQISLCGSWFEIFNNGEVIGINRPAQSPLLIAYRYSYQSEVGHPTVIFRKSLAGDKKVFYPERKAEDYFLFSKLATQIRFSNLPQVLLKYRTHSNSKSEVEKKSAIDEIRIYSSEYFVNLGIESSLSSTWVDFHHLREVPLGKIPALTFLYFQTSSKLIKNLSAPLEEQFSYYASTSFDFCLKALKQFYRRFRS
jgi:glycosyltransferase involved in cell wall biosynthesis